MLTKNSKLVPAVVLSCHTIGLGVIRGLGVMGVPIVAVSYEKKYDMGYLSKYVKERIYTPHPEKHEKEFIEILKEYSVQNGRMFLVPADDPTLVIVSKNKHELDKYYIIQCTDWDITQRILARNSKRIQEMVNINC